jgi:hypothetical protein
MEIDIKKAAFPFSTFLVYGDSGAGKTRLVAGCPKAAWIGSHREDGWQTIAAMPSYAFYDGTPPRVFPVKTIEEAWRDIDRVILPAVRAGKIKTVIAELTIHADDVMRLMDVDERNGWARYRGLEDYVQRLDLTFKHLPGVRVVYNTLALPEDKAGGTSGVLMPGKALARKIPAMCSVTAYMRQERTNDGVDHVLHFAAYGNFSPRHRYSDRLPEVVRWRRSERVCQFRDLEDIYYGRAQVDTDGYVIRDAVVDDSKPGKLISLPPLGGAKVTVIRGTLPPLTRKEGV